VADLQKCFMDGGVSPSTIFCNGQQTQTATATGGASKTGKGGATNSADATKTGAATGISKAGLGMLGMIVVSVFVGAII
jgi:hypothetical protein